MQQQQDVVHEARQHHRDADGVDGAQEGRTARRDERERVREQVQPRRGCEFRVPEVEGVGAVQLGLGDMEDFVLGRVSGEGRGGRGGANQGAGMNSEGGGEEGRLTRYGSGTWELTRLQTKAVAAASGDRRGMRGCIIPRAPGGVESLSLRHTHTTDSCRDGCGVEPQPMSWDEMKHFIGNHSDVGFIYSVIIYIR